MKIKSKLLSLVVGICLLSVGQLFRISEAAKIDCYPIDGATKEKCEALGCTWKPVNHNTNSSKLAFNKDDPLVKTIVGGIGLGSDIKEPWCYFPDDYQYGYKVKSVKQEGIILTRVKPSVFKNDIEEVKVTIEQVNGRVARVKFFDPNKERYEPDLPKINRNQPENQNLDYSLLKIDIIKGGYELIIRREGAIMLAIDLTKIIFADKFIQINSQLDSPFVYGLGEHYDRFLKKADSYKSYSFYNTDKLPLPGGRRSYGSFPFYINLDSDNLQYAHGVYLHNSNAMDIILQPDQSITFRSIGGVMDFYILFGLTPLEVIQQYQQLVGMPNLPPMWSLGFHLCRYNYNTLEKTKLVWQRTRDAGIPFDVQWNDIDYMDKHNDFTYDHVKFNGLPDFVDNSLHKNNMHYMILFDPGLSQEENFYPYKLGREMDIFIKNATNQVLVGKVWNDSGKTVFPDFSNPASIEYWSKLFKKFQDEEIKFDGAWIDMNDISNFVYGSLDGCPKENYLEQTPYKPGGYDLQTNSLCLSAKHEAGSEYDLHNLYSFYETIATYKALEASRPGKRPFIISRSTFPGQGHYGGHWSGDVLSNWDYLRWSIPSLIEHSMYGFSMMGSDICGFVGNTNPQLCARWSTLGAFYTFVRNHNDDVSIDQDPVALGPEVVRANKNALTNRYALLPYLYTLLHKAHRFGEPVVRSIPFEFYLLDQEALNVEYQFLWGEALMISPVVEENSYEKKTYLPKGRWYESNIILKQGQTNSKQNLYQPLQEVPKIIDSNSGWFETKNISLSDMPLFYRGGYIVPAYRIVQSTIAETVKDQPIALRVFLPDDSVHPVAKGELYIDDGDNVDGKYNYVRMEFDKTKLYIILDKNDFKNEISFGHVNFYGITSNIKGVKVNDRSISFKRNEHVISCDLEATSVSKGNPITVELVVE